MRKVFDVLIKGVEVWRHYYWKRPGFLNRTFLAFRNRTGTVLQYAVNRSDFRRICKISESDY